MSTENKNIEPEPPAENISKKIIVADETPIPVPEAIVIDDQQAIHPQL